MAQVRAFILKDGKVGKNLGEIYVTDLTLNQYRRVSDITFHGDILPDHEIIAAFKSIEDFRVAIIHYGGFEQQDMFGDQ